MSGLNILHFATWALLTALAAPAAEPADQAPATQPDEEVIEAVTGGLRSGQARARQAAVSAAVEIGEPIVPALLEMALDSPGRGSTEAQRALQLMGTKARPALPRLLELAADKTANPPADARQANSPRLAALAILKNMKWAADEATPVLREVAEDEAEDGRVRQAAVIGLGGMGKEGIPALRKLADGPEGVLREKARDVLATTLQEQGVQTRAKYFAALVEADMYDRHVPEYLRSVQPRSSLGQAHPLAAKVKAAYRSRLKEKPDAQIARSLARIVQDQLAGTTLEWVAPGGRSTSAWFREDPAENNEMLAAALSLGFEQAEEGSQLAAELGVALARVRLLQGDFEGMNATLKRLGWDALAIEQRPWLAAPPVKWGEDLAKQWQAADEEMRSGDCGLVVRVEKDGRGLRGAHIIVKPAVESSRPTVSAFHADAPLPVPRSEQAAARSLPLATADRLQALRLAGLTGTSRGSSFGYDASDRPMTRYGVTDETGQVKFEKLPEQDVQIEVHVPTANFAESGRGWELWMEVEPGKMKRATAAVGVDAVGPKDPPALVELVAGRTVTYPRLVVVPLVDLEVEDWSEADMETFELSWPAARSTSGEKVAYEVEMALSGPGQSSAVSDSIPTIRSTRQVVDENRWAVGAKGVGGQRLSPGSIHFFRVVARDAHGEVLARSMPRRVWTPWAERKSPPPYTGAATARQSPIRVETSNRRLSTALAARTEKLSARVERFLRANPDAFEREYAQVGAAWLSWSDGDEKAARRQLEELIEALPAGSVPQATARWLLDAVENGEEPPVTLKLVAPRALAPEE